MRFLQQLLLLNGINISYTFTPSYPKSKISAPHRQLQYVRHEDEIEWIDTNFHQPPSPPQNQRQESLCLYMFYNVISCVQYEVSSLSLHLTLVCLYFIAFATLNVLTEVTISSLLPS